MCVVSGGYVCCFRVCLFCRGMSVVLGYVGFIGVCLLCRGMSVVSEYVLCRGMSVVSGYVCCVMLTPPLHLFRRVCVCVGGCGCVCLGVFVSGCLFMCVCLSVRV